MPRANTVDEGFDNERLAQDFSDLLLPGESASASDIKACVDDFFARTVVSMPEQAMGGVIEEEVAESAQAELANQS